MRPIASWALTLLVLSGALVGTSRFLRLVETRPGVVLPDPVLVRLVPQDHSTLTFSLIYGGIVFGIASVLRQPERLRRLMDAYVVLILLRMLLMSVTPLDPPAGIVPLRDDILERFGPAQALTRDLFFSGHVGTAVLVSMGVPRTWQRVVLLSTAVALAVLLLLQHVHYTVDVLAAPLFAYAAHRLVAQLPGHRTPLPEPRRGTAVLPPAGASD